MEALAARLNLCRSIGVDPDHEASVAHNRVASAGIEEALWPLRAHGCVFDAAADEWVPVRSSVPCRHRI